MVDLTVAPVSNIGHNKPPSDIEILSERLTLDHVTLIRQAEDHEKFSYKIPGEFTSDLDVEFTSDYIKKVQICKKALEDVRVVEKEPFLRQGKLVDTFFSDLKTKLDIAVTRANAPLTAYLNKKAEEEKRQRESEAIELRRQQEAAFKEAAEIGNSGASEETKQAVIEHAVTMAGVADTAQAVAAVPMVNLAHVKGKISAANLKEEWSGTITDMELLDIRKLRPYFTAPELQKAVDRFVKQGGRQCEGVKIDKVISTKVK